MKTHVIFNLVLTFLLLCFFSLSVSAQRIKPSTTLPQKGISAADQQAIKAIFADLDSSKYRLQFDGGTKAVGSKTVQMRDLNQVKRVTNPAESAGYIVLIVEGKDVIYVLAVGSSQLESVLGKQKAAQLNTIMAKYKR